MNIKLIPIKAKKKPKNRYILYVEFMSGDADHYETVKYFCKDEEEFKTVYAKVLEGLEEFGYNSDSSKQREHWCKIFDEERMEIPYDVTSDGYPAQLSSIEGVYYDENGVKFEAVLV